MMHWMQDKVLPHQQAAEKPVAERELVDPKNRIIKKPERGVVKLALENNIEIHSVLYYLCTPKTKMS